MKKLLLGDSVTDAGRDFENDRELGHGYVKMIADQLEKEDITVINRGVSANRWRICIVVLRQMRFHFNQM